MPAETAPGAGSSATAADPMEARQRRRNRRRRALVLIVQVVVVAAFIGVWEIGTQIRTTDHFVIDPFLWSRPSSIARRIGDWMVDGTVQSNIFITLYEAAMALLTGGAAGIIVGFLLARSEFWAWVWTPFIQVFNAVPRLIFAPIFFIVFGLDEGSKIALGFTLVFFITFFNVFQGIRDVDRSVYNNVRMLGANERQMTWHVLLPSAMSWILSSLHIAVGFAMSSAIVGEYLGSSRGLGHVISRSLGNLDMTGVMAGLVVLCSVVVVVEVIVTRIERWLGRWKPQPAGDLDRA